MKQPHVSRTLFFVLILSIALPFLGCITDRLTSSTAQPKDPNAVAAIDKEIARIKQRIADLRKLETQQRQIAVINEMANYKSQGWAKPDGQPSYEDVSEMRYMQAAAAEKEIKQLENLLAKAQAEKEKM
jgi:hypothetical protein